MFNENVGLPRPRSLLPVPPRLAFLVEQLDGPEQPSVLLDVARWRKQPGVPAEVVDLLPTQLSRVSVREFVASALAKDSSLVPAFIASQIWGYGTTNYGPWRLSEALASERLEDALLASYDLLEAGDPVGACRMLCVDHRIPQLGTAFATKFLYFADPNRQSLILDSLIRGWLVEHAGLRLAGHRDEREYATWLLLAEGWAGELGVANDAVELTIFNDALPAGSSWRTSE